MVTIYIKEWEGEEVLNKNIPTILKNIFMKIIKKINIIIEKNLEEYKKIYYIPNIEKRNVCEKLSKKIQKEQTKTQKVQIVLSNKLKKYEENFKRIKIVNGKIIYQKLLEQVIEEILQENVLAMQDIYIVTNRYDKESVNIISKLELKAKSINIITNKIDQYKQIEDKLTNLGIAVCVANNKRKSLKKAGIIININLKENELSQYVINRNAIIINLSLEKITKLKSFDGVIVQDIKIELNEKEEKIIKENNLEKSFKKLEIYESIMNNMEINEVKVKEIYGNNGKIEKKELRNVQKILTNVKN